MTVRGPRRPDPAVRGPGQAPVLAAIRPWSAGAGGGLLWTPYERAGRSDAFTRDPSAAGARRLLEPPSAARVARAGVRQSDAAAADPIGFLRGAPVVDTRAAPNRKRVFMAGMRRGDASASPRQRLRHGLSRNVTINLSTCSRVGALTAGRSAASGGVEAVIQRCGGTKEPRLTAKRIRRLLLLPLVESGRGSQRAPLRRQGLRTAVESAAGHERRSDDVTAAACAWDRGAELVGARPAVFSGQVDVCPSGRRGVGPPRATVEVSGAIIGRCAPLPVRCRPVAPYANRPCRDPKSTT